MRSPFKEGATPPATALTAPPYRRLSVPTAWILILANATPALQAAATSEIPILGTSVTDYAFALEIESWTGTTGGNISGTSDLAPPGSAGGHDQEWFPDAQTVGLLYCSAEPNSVYQCDVITGYLEEYGYTVSATPSPTPMTSPPVAQTACDNSDVIYIPTDNTAANNTESHRQRGHPRRSRHRR